MSINNTVLILGLTVWQIFCRHFIGTCCLGPRSKVLISQTRSQEVPAKCRFISAMLRLVTYQKTEFLFCTASQTVTYSCCGSFLVPQKNTRMFICSRGHSMAHLVMAQRCNPEGRRFDSRCCRHCQNYMVVGQTQTLTEMSTRNFLSDEGGKGGRYVGLTALTHSCAGCLEIWEPQPQSLSGPVQRFFYFYLLIV